MTPVPFQKVSTFDASRVLNKRLSFFGSLNGLLGAFILALNTSFSGIGFGFFLISNLLLIAFFIRTRVLSLVIMQLGFTATSLLGLYFWLFR
jgi:nicotinamide riboside transporter PnuC